METSSLPPPPHPGPELTTRRSARTRRFPQLWREFEATSYTPVAAIPLANEEVFEQQLPPPLAEPAALITPDMSQPSSNRSPLDKYRICRVYSSIPVPPTTDDNQDQPSVPTPPPHPFKNDSTFEMVKAFCLGPSSKTTAGMNQLVQLFTSGRVTQEELRGFNSVKELRLLDNFAGKSKIAGGPCQTGSVKIKMPCMRTNSPPFSREKDAPDFEVHGVRYRSLVDLLVSKVQDPTTSGSFIHTPFTEWWCPPGSTTPIWIYGEAYSSNVAVQLSEEIKAIPPPADHPNIESVIVLLMLGSDATHLTNFGTASLWPIYVFFGNMSKYDSSRPSEFPACHLAYLPKVEWPGIIVECR